MIRKLATATCLFGLAISSVGLMSCKKSFTVSSYASSSSSRSDWTVNDKRTITKKVDDQTRKLETTTDVKLEQGKITTLPKGTVVKVEEVGSTILREAEVRENGGSQELWVKENGTFRRGTSEEEAWLAEFLKDVIGE